LISSVCWQSRIASRNFDVLKYPIALWFQLSAIQGATSIKLDARAIASEKSWALFNRLERVKRYFLRG
jgi:hypothetical protein